MSKIIHFRPHPSSTTLAGDVRTYDTDTEPPLPEGFMRQTPEAFAAWEVAEKAAGWAPQYPAPVTVPESVRKAQLQQWLIDQDMLSSVDAVFTAGHPIWQGNDKARLKAQARWEYEVNVRRDDTLVNAFIPLLGLTADQVDEAFRFIEANYP